MIMSTNMFVLSEMVGSALSLFLVTWSAKVVGIDVTLPYLQGISEKRNRENFNINVAHKPVMTVGSIKKKNLKTSLVKIYRQE